MKPRRIFTWHIHGSYLYYLAQTGCTIFVPVRPGRPTGYIGRPAGGFPWPDTVCEVPVEEVPRLQFDCILFQAKTHYQEDQYQIFSAEQRRLPQIYLEHDPPRLHPTDTRHPVNDPHVLLVHVTHFNNLMWDNGRTPTRVIEHGVMIPSGVAYAGDLARGLVVINGLRARGRRLGLDVFERVRKKISLDLIGIKSDELSGLGEIPHADLPAFAARYRFFFNPIRYTSLGLAVCEAMMLGMPIVALATAEMATVIENGISGYIDTDVGMLMKHMRKLLSDTAEARRLGEGARRRAQERFNINRFVDDWANAFALVTA